MPRYFTFILAILFSSAAYSQSSCQPNIDFELGNLSYWHYYTGSCCPISTPTSTSPIPNRHTLTSGTATDPYGGFPIVAPNGGNYSLRLGNDSGGAQAEKARYYIHVPSGVSNYDLIYRYAVVLQNPNHTASQQPRYEIAVYDSATNAQMPCNTFTYVASGSLPGFSLSSYGTSVYYKPWTTGVINLSGYAGHTMIIDFATGDCSLGAHFGYGYLDMTCGLFQISTVQCNLSGYTTLNAPPGFQSYVWKDSALTTTIATGQTVSIPTPSVSTLYKVILTPYTGYGCPDTLSTTIIISNLAINSSNDTAICVNTSVLLHAGASGGIAPLTYSWTPTTGLSCNNCANPIASPSSNITYHVMVMDSSGCSRSDSIEVTFKPTPVLSSSLTPPAICNNTLFSYTPTSTTQGTTFSWHRAAVAGISNPASSGSGSVGDTLINTTSNPVNVTYKYILNASGCPDTQNVVVTVNPSPVLSNNFSPPNICNNATFNYMPNSATPGTTFSWSRAAIAGVANAAASGTGSIGEVLLDSTNNVVSATYAYTLSANGCVHTQNISVNVKPTPSLSSTLSPGAACSNALFTYMPGSTVASTSFSWSRDTVTGISNAAGYGTGNVYDTLINITANPVNVNYQYTLNASGCTNIENVVVAINPSPVLNSSLSPAAICNNTMFNYIPGSATSGTTFSWSRAVVVGISNAAGSGTGSIAEVLLDSTSAAANVSYLYTLTANGCTHSQDVVVNVKPTPVLSSALYPAGVCTNTLFNYIAGSTIATTSFAWNRPFVYGISNPATYGMGNIYETLVNVTSSNINVTYIYVLTSNGCTDTQHIIVPIKVYPSSATVGSNNPICQYDTVFMTAGTSSIGASYSWSGPNNYTSALQNPQILNAQLNISGVYTVIISLDGCNDTLHLPIVVNTLLGAPTISVSVLPNDTVCGGTMLYFNSSITNAGNPAYQWMKNGVGIAGATSASYATPSSVNGDIITCKIASSSICQPINTASSNAVKLDIISLLPPSVSVSSYPLHYKTGDTVTFTGHVPQGLTGLTYRWMKNGVFINYATTSIFTTNNVKTGDSICFVTYSSVPCTIPDSSVACVQLSTEVPLNNLKAELKVWPNPVLNELNIEGAETGSLVKIYNVVGQEIYFGIIKSPLEHINTSKFIKGVYLMELSGVNGDKDIRRFVKE